MRLIPVLIPLLIGCGSKPAVERTPAAPTTQPPADSTSPVPTDHVAPPFGAADLRAGIPVGTEIKYRIESAGGPAVIEHWLFTAADDNGCTIHARVLDEAGNLLRDEGEGSSSWAELESHAHFPAALTTRSDSSVEVTAGHFETWLFEVKPAAAGEPLRRYQFARNLPGPPVLLEVVKDGEVVMRMELLSRTQP